MGLGSRSSSLKAAGWVSSYHFRNPGWQAVPALPRRGLLPLSLFSSSLLPPPYNFFPSRRLSPGSQYGRRCRRPARPGPGGERSPFRLRLTGGACAVRCGRGPSLKSDVRRVRFGFSSWVTTEKLTSASRSAFGSWKGLLRSTLTFQSFYATVKKDWKEVCPATLQIRRKSSRTRVRSRYCCSPQNRHLENVQPSLTQSKTTVGSNLMRRNWIGEDGEMWLREHKVADKMQRIPRLPRETGEA
ncbi:uncharacterized protein LOC110344231 [Heterocephalus glaber]|uniref:Uncharacterized protein LOC110344231 n=1 Tax=Heterocephalus glaber TaxID=10181 RepID=A0AAX6R7F7_HETGA|nr:uncharacterized protein LOC110344231 [Heterocephalus glaber]